MTARHWAVPYLGIPWVKDGDGPDGFQCWAFVRFVQDRHFGRALPAIPNPDDVMAWARTFRDHPERRRWTRADAPAEGDCVLMRQARYPVHVGVWIAPPGERPGVLHCAMGTGVVFQRPDHLALAGWSIEGFYRFNDEGRP